MRFPEMPYERPDMDEVKQHLESLTAALRAAKTYAEAKQVFLE